MKQLSRGMKSDKNHVATTRDLKKLLVFLSIQGNSNRNAIRKGTGLSSGKINDGIRFLKSIRIIAEGKSNNCIKHYKISI